MSSSTKQPGLQQRGPHGADRQRGSQGCSSAGHTAPTDNAAARAATMRAKRRRQTTRQPGLQQCGPKQRRQTTRQPGLQQSAGPNGTDRQRGSQGCSIRAQKCRDAPMMGQRYVGKDTAAYFEKAHETSKSHCTCDFGKNLPNFLEK